MIEAKEVIAIIDRMTEIAKRKQTQPAVPTAAMREAWLRGSDLGGMGFKLSSLGDFVPDGWELVETHFVDTSGFGRSDEPALSFTRFAKLLATANPKYGFAVTSAGQFPAHVGEYKPVPFEPVNTKTKRRSAKSIVQDAPSRSELRARG